MPGYRLLRKHEVVQVCIGRRKHALSDLEALILVAAGSRLHESRLQLHHVQPIEDLERIVLLGRRDVNRLHDTAGTLKRLGRRLYGGRNFGVGRPEAVDPARFPPPCRTARGLVAKPSALCLGSFISAEYDDLPQAVKKEVQAFADVNVAWLSRVLSAAGVVGPENSDRRAISRSSTP